MAPPPSADDLDRRDADAAAAALAAFLARKRAPVDTSKSAA